MIGLFIIAPHLLGIRPGFLVCLDEQKIVSIPIHREAERMTNEEDRGFREVEETAVRERWEELERRTVELCTFGYDVIITSESGVDKSDLKLIIRKASSNPLFSNYNWIPPIKDDASHFFREIKHQPIKSRGEIMNSHL